MCDRFKMQIRTNSANRRLSDCEADDQDDRHVEEVGRTSMSAEPRRRFRFWSGHVVSVPSRQEPKQRSGPSPLDKSDLDARGSLNDNDAAASLVGNHFFLMRF